MMTNKNRVEKLEKVIKPKDENITIRVGFDGNEEEWQRKKDAGEILTIKVKDDKQKSS